MFTIYSNELNGMIRELGQKHGLSAEDAYAIARHQFLYVKDVMRSSNESNLATFKNVMLVHFGTFHLKPSKLNSQKQLDEHEQLIRMVT